MEQPKDEYIACWVNVEGGRVMRKVHIHDLKHSKKTVTAFRAHNEGDSIECLPEEPTQGLERIHFGKKMIIPFPS